MLAEQLSMKRTQSAASHPLVVRNPEPIAIVGIGCRFPGHANSPAAFWEMLLEGRDAITEVPQDRWSSREFYHPDPEAIGTSRSKWGGFLSDVAHFEPEMFGISPREADHIDPQQRLLLEVAWEAFEDAGQPIEQLSDSSVGVFVGISTDDYSRIQAELEEATTISPHAYTGGAFSIAANRISYCFDFSGPSIAVDTACSSSLVATHLACTSLWNGECQVALAGGVNVMILPQTFVGFSHLSMLSPQGRCKTFDASADGFVRGEGAGTVLLKPLSKAQEDSDRIYALIRASGTNQDGKTGGITFPNGDAQEMLLRRNLELASVRASDIVYLEAHGTATPVGDPVEARALGSVLAVGRGVGNFCAVGSVKTNIGHLEAAAGIAGLIKTALVLHHRVCPPHLHFHEPNPAIDWKRLKLQVVTQPTKLANNNSALLAAVNSFGFGGTNANVILEEAPRSDLEKTDRPRQGVSALMLPISARHSGSLRGIAEGYRRFLASSAKPDLELTCRAASLRKSHFDERLALVGETRAEFLELLDAYLAGETRAELRTGRKVPGKAIKLAFVFSGQGPQWWGMGRQLLHQEPLFAETLLEIDQYIKKLGTWSLLEQLSAEEDKTRIHETAIAQPAIFAVQLGLARLWESWGIKPGVVLGHSIGEVAAACIAGVFTLEAATEIVFHRGRSMDRATSEGKMMAAGLSPEEAEEILRDYEGRVAVAAANSPKSVALSGEPGCLSAIAKKLESQDLFCRPLQIGYAFHSHLMDPTREDLITSLRGIVPNTTTVDLISTVTGKLVKGTEIDAEYWWQNVRQTVLFADAMRSAVERGVECFLEISPHPVLGYNMRECLEELGDKAAIFFSLRRNAHERKSLLANLGGLYSVGYPIDWGRLWPGRTEYFELPRYPWKKKSYWNESQKIRDWRLGKRTHPLLQRRADAADPSWELLLDSHRFPFLQHHQVQGRSIFPASGYLEMVMGAGRDLFAGQVFALEQVDFSEVLYIPPGDSRPVAQLTYNPTDNQFRIFGREAADTKWVSHCTGRLRPEGDREASKRADLRAIKERCHTVFKQKDCYQATELMGLQLGPTFRCVKQIWRRDHEALAEVAALESEDSPDYLYHPGVLDSCFQVIIPAQPWKGGTPERETFVPTRFERLRFYAPATRVLYSHFKLLERTATFLVGDLRVYDADGNSLLDIDGFRCERIAGMMEQLKFRPGENVYEMRWYHQERPDEKVQITNSCLPNLVKLRPSLNRYIKNAKSSFDWLRQHRKLEPLLDEYCCSAIVEALGNLGLDLSSERAFSLEELLRKLAIEPRFSQVLQLFFAALNRRGYAFRQENGWRFAKPAEWRTSRSVWTEALRRHPAFLAELALVSRVADKIPEILRGELDVLELIFPQGQSRTAEHLYQDAPSFKTHNSLVAFIVEQLSKRLPVWHQLRILEIGAGTGGLTRTVLPGLPSDRTSYLFTDVSNLFFLKAQQKFQAFPYLDYQLFDVEKDPYSQGFEANSFDLILASSVIHATRDIRSSIENVRMLLKPGGWLLMIEGDRSPLWADLVFGMTEGWWKFRDQALRPDHPFLSKTKWHSVLSETGFDEVESYAGAEDVDESSQLVIAARLTPTDSTTSFHLETETDNEPAAENWLILSDTNGRAEQLASILHQHQGRSILAYRSLDHHEDEQAICAVNSREELSRLLASSRKKSSIQRIVFFWSPSAMNEKDFATSILGSHQHRLCMKLIWLCQLLAQWPSNELPKLSLVTSGAHRMPGESQLSGLEQSVLTGLGRTLMNEHPELSFQLIDVGPRTWQGEAKCLYSEISRDSRDPEVVLRKSLRLIPSADVLKPSKAFQTVRLPTRQRFPAFRLIGSTTRRLDELSFQGFRRTQLNQREIEIQVKAAGLNFRDVLKCLGLYPDEDQSTFLLGDECSGIVTRVGKGVQNIQPGDQVMALAPGSFGSIVRTHEDLALKKPPQFSFEEAATTPVAFLTAYYSLRTVGLLQPGERVLIQAAAGGVGLAAIQIANHIGAEIYATASAPKHWLLEQLGIEHIMDSRSTRFRDQISTLTNGKGVDLVLNSLAGEALQKGVESLAPHGRFVEIGKRDIYLNSKFGLRLLKNNLSFHVIDLAGIFMNRLPLVRTLLDELANCFAKGTFQPLPFRMFSASQISDAFRHMSQGKHTGKLVIDFQQGSVNVKKIEVGPKLSPNATYLISGGLGGFGLLVADWMLKIGARNLVLLSRRSGPDNAARRAIAKLEAKGARVLTFQCDVSDEEALTKVFQLIRSELPPLRGVFHLAMVLEDQTLLKMEESSLARVLAPKVAGSWNLHRLTSRDPLDYFVLFSSVASWVGNPGQGNYAAGNAFLDALAYYRREHGLPATSINWGRLLEVGYVARNKSIGERLTKMGSRGLKPTEAISVLEYILQLDLVQVAATSTNWKQMLNESGASEGLLSRFGQLAGRSAESATENSEQKADEKRRELLQASEKERIALVRHHLTEQVAQVLGTSALRVDPETPLADQGLDSLMAIELKNRLETGLRVSLPTSELASSPTVASLSSFLCAQISGTKTQEDHQKTSEIVSHEAFASYRSRLLKLRKGTGPMSVFCLHPAGGNVGFYRYLADSLSDRWSIWSVPSRSLVDGSEEFDSLSEMVADYCMLISNEARNNPVACVGFSFGGPLAFLVASGLEKIGTKVSLVAMLDPVLRSPTEQWDPSELLRYYFSFLSSELGTRDRTQDSVLEEAIGHLCRSMADELEESDELERSLQTFERLGIPSQQVFRLVSLFRRHIALLEDFTPQPIKAPLAIVRVATPPFRLDPSQIDWQRVTKGGITDRIVEGDHISILYPPRVQQVANLLETQLERYTTMI